MSLDWEPPTDHSPTARRIRFGCGGMVGMRIGARIAWEVTDFEFVHFAVGASVGFVLAGFVASGAGDEVWEWLTDQLR